MRTRILTALAAAAALTFTLSACASEATPEESTGGTSVIAPVTMDVGDLQGATVDLVVGQALNINTGDLAPESYSGEVSDTSVAEFVAGGDDGSATFNPGVMALAEGSTDVVLSNDDGGIEDVSFTVEVSAG